MARLTHVTLSDQALKIICEGLDLLQMVETTLEDEHKANYARRLRRSIIGHQLATAIEDAES
jgi:hypothetical protein